MRYWWTLGLVSIILLALAAIPAPPSRAATTFTVNSAANNGDANVNNPACDIDEVTPGDQCTLRAAIDQANATAGQDTIEFSIGSGWQRIEVLAGALPPIGEPIVID